MSAMTTSSTTVDLFTQHLRFDSQGTIRADERRTAGDNAWRLPVFHVETDADVQADHWERHPGADEAVCCLQGTIRLHVPAVRPGRPDEVVRLLSGQAVIVPRDRWHRLELDEPSDLLVATAPGGTQHEPTDRPGPRRQLAI
jgi:quercetin dioxygenase-like cupin family protein